MLNKLIKLACILLLTTTSVYAGGFGDLMGQFEKVAEGMINQGTNKSQQAAPVSAPAPTKKTAPVSAPAPTKKTASSSNQKVMSREEFGKKCQKVYGRIIESQNFQGYLTFTCFGEHKKVGPQYDNEYDQFDFKLGSDDNKFEKFVQKNNTNPSSGIKKRNEMSLKIINEYKKGTVKYASHKELCSAIIKEAGVSTASWTNVSWMDGYDCDIWYDTEFLRTKYIALKPVILAERESVLAEREKIEEQRKRGIDEIKAAGRLYAGIAMDTTLKQNNIKINEYAGKRYVIIPDYAGLPVDISYGEDGYIFYETRGYDYDLGKATIYSISLGGKIELDKLTQIYNSIKSKYKSIGVKEEEEKISLKQAQARILDWHQRNRSTQAAYEAGLETATAIRITKKWLTYDNAGDKITLKIVATEAGPDTSYTMKVTYLSKIIVQKELAEAEKKRKIEEAKNAKANSELTDF